MSALVSLMTRTTLCQNLGIPASRGNRASYVQDDGRNNTSSVLPDWEPWPNLGPDGRDPETLAI